MKKILVTGGSGFIGTNAVELFLAAGNEVLNIDIKKPQNANHIKNFKKVDILDISSLRRIVSEFAPAYVVHLAARTDLRGKTLDDYEINTIGVRNMLNVISQQLSVQRFIFASTKLVCKNGYYPKFDEDYCPNTVYGQSKVAGEEIVRTASTLSCDWCIVRPSSIWGPWF